MKKVIYFLSLFYILTFTGCTDRYILDSKEGQPIDPVSNLQYTITGTDVNLTWTNPSNFPVDIKAPVSIFIRVMRNNVSISTVTLPNAPNSYVYTPYDSTKSYIIIVKVLGNVDTIDHNLSNLRYSLGSSVIF